MKRFASYVLAGLALFLSCAAPVAAQQPVQWNYDFSPVNVARATYPGNVKVNSLAGSGARCVQTDATGLLSPASSGCASTNGFIGLSGSPSVGNLLKFSAVGVTPTATNAVAGTDYAPPTSGAALLYGNGAGGFSNATVGSGLSFSGGSLSLIGAVVPTAQFVRSLATGSASGEAFATTLTQMLLNTAAFNNISGASLAANVVTLPIGTYIYNLNIPISASSSSITACILGQLTPSVVTLAQTPNIYTQASSVVSSRGVFTLAAAATLNIQCATTAVSNVGGGALNKGLPEIYEQITFEKIG